MSRLKQIGVDVDVHNAIMAARRSFGETENEVLRRLLLTSCGSKPTRPLRNAPSKVVSLDTGEDRPARARGLWTVEFQGQREPAANLKDAYRLLLSKLSDNDEDFLQKLSEEKSRSRRYVARKPELLYGNSPHLASHHARLLKPGWYYDTNLSTAQVSSRVRIAARIANLRYGKDLRLLEGLKEI